MIFKNLKNEIKLDELFRFDKKSNSYIIDIFVDHYEALYSTLDFSPFKNKDLDDELIAYLEDSIEDIPFRYNLLLNINMPQNIYDKVKETRGIKEIKHYFLYLHKKKKKEIYEIYRSAMGNFITGILFIFAISIIKKKSFPFSSGMGNNHRGILCRRLGFPLGIFFIAFFRPQ